MGAERFVCVFKKNSPLKFSSISEIKSLDKGVLVGPGASGKTRLLHLLYNKEVTYKGSEILKNTVFNHEGDSLKLPSNIHEPSSAFPFVYIAPNFSSLKGFVPNVSAWIALLKKVGATAIVCYVPPGVHKQRIDHRVIHKPSPLIEQHLDNLSFSYQALFHQLATHNIPYLTIDCSNNDYKSNS